jgi:hypothetical protein
LVATRGGVVADVRAGAEWRPAPQHAWRGGVK